MKSAFKDVTSQIMSNIGTVVLSFPLAIILARLLGPLEFGTFNLLQTVATTALLVSSFGITDACLFYVSKAVDKDWKAVYAGNALIIGTAIAAIATLIVLTLSDGIEMFYGIPGLGFLMRLFSVEILAESIINIFLSVMLGFNLFRSNAIMKLLAIVFRIFSVIFALYLGLLGATLGRMFAWVISLAIIAVLFYRLFITKLQKKAISELFIYGLPRYISSLLYLVIKELPILIVGLYGSLQVGIFSAADRIAMIITLGVIAIITVGTQRTALRFGKGEETKHLVYKVTKYSFYLATFLAFAIIPFGSQMINIVYTESYSGAVLPLIILSLAALLESAYVGPTVFLLGTGKPKDATFISITMAVSTVIASVYLIPQLKVVGACIAIFISKCAGALASIIISSRYNVTIPTKPIMRAILPGVLMSIVILITSKIFDTIPAAILSTIFGTTTFLSALYLVGGIESDDIELIRDLLPRRIRQMF